MMLMTVMKMKTCRSYDQQQESELSAVTDELLTWGSV